MARSHRKSKSFFVNEPSYEKRRTAKNETQIPQRGRFGD